MATLGIMMYFLERFGFSAAPLVLGLILGPIAEANFIQGSMIANATEGMAAYFFAGVLNIGLVSIVILSVVYSVWMELRGRRPAGRDHWPSGTVSYGLPPESSCRRARARSGANRPSARCEIEFNGTDAGASGVGALRSFRLVHRATTAWPLQALLGFRSGLPPSASASSVAAATTSDCRATGFVNYKLTE